MRRKLYRSIAVLAALAAAFAVSSCQGSNEIDDPAPASSLTSEISEASEVLGQEYFDAGWDAQISILDREGAASEDVFLEAAELGKNCVDTNVQGYPMFVGFSPVDHSPMFRGFGVDNLPIDTVNAGRKYRDVCYAAHVELISKSYSETRTNFSMSPDLRDYLVSCLEDSGEHPSGSENTLSDFRSTIDNSDYIVEECVAQGVETLYPGLEVVL